MTGRDRFVSWRLVPTLVGVCTMVYTAPSFAKEAVSGFERVQGGSVRVHSRGGIAAIVEDGVRVMAATNTDELLVDNIRELQINCSIQGGSVMNLTPAGTDPDGDGVFNYAGSAIDPDTGVELSWDLNRGQDPLIIRGTLAVLNNTDQTIELFLQVILPISESLPDGTEIAGSAALGLTTDSGGGTLASVSGIPIWQGLIDAAAPPYRWFRRLCGAEQARKGTGEANEQRLAVQILRDDVVRLRPSLNAPAAIIEKRKMPLISGVKRVSGMQM